MILPMPNTQGSLKAVALSAEISVSKLECAINAIPNPPQELVQQLRATIAVLQGIARIPDGINVDTVILEIITIIGNYCEDVKSSVSLNQCDWATFDHQGSNSTAITHVLKMRTSTIFVGIVRTLEFVSPSRRRINYANIR
jgi:hypothetical protein